MGGRWLEGLECWELRLLVLKLGTVGFLVGKFAVLLVVFLWDMM
jgi:hypothetical protein